jgi:hypothetical protein
VVKRVLHEVILNLMPRGIAAVDAAERHELDRTEAIGGTHLVTVGIWRLALVVVPAANEHAMHNDIPSHIRVSAQPKKTTAAATDGNERSYKRQRTTTAPRVSAVMPAPPDRGTAAPRAVR